MSDFDTLFTQLFTQRQFYGKKYQPPHSIQLFQLEKELKRLGHNHPYAGDIAVLKQIALTNPAFREGGHGLPAKPPVKAKSFYRICPVRNLRNYVSTWNISPLLSTKGIYDLLKQDSKSARGWLRLEDYAGGTLSGPRNVSWWTTFAIEPDTIIENALNLGLLGEWVNSYSLILRCSISSVTAGVTATVPNVIDAFAQPIFEPSLWSRKPRFGTTIDIRRPDKLVRGKDEYVLRPIAVEYVELLPLLVEDSQRSGYLHAHEFSEPLLDLLQEYAKRRR